MKTHPPSFYRIITLFLKFHHTLIQHASVIIPTIIWTHIVTYLDTNTTYLLVLRLISPRRGLGEDGVVLVAACRGGGGRAASCSVLVEQGHRAEFRYRIIVRCVNCTIRVHRCGWYSKGGRGGGRGREEGAGGQCIDCGQANALLFGTHTYTYTLDFENVCLHPYIYTRTHVHACTGRQARTYVQNNARRPCTTRVHTWVIDVAALVVQHHVFHLHNDRAVAVVRRVLEGLVRFLIVVEFHDVQKTIPQVPR